MKRGRGRPVATTRDVQLLWYVRNAKEQGLTVERACARGYRAGYLTPPGSSDDPVSALKRRYERTARKYPDPFVEMTYRIMGVPIKRKARLSLGAAILSVERIQRVK